MSQRYTIKDVRTAFERLCDEVKRHGIDPTGWVLHEGSKTYGRAFRAYDKDGHSLPFTDGNGYLGMTAAETTAVLNAAQGGMYAVRTMRKG